MKHAKKQTTKTGARAPGKRSTRTRATKTTRASGSKRRTTAPRGKTPRDPRLPATGATLTRAYKGRELRLEVLAEGFRFEGETFRSLTAAALRATGYKAISGPHFWKIGAAASGKEGTTERASD